MAEAKKGCAHQVHKITTVWWCFHAKEPSMTVQDLPSPALPLQGILSWKKYIPKTNKFSGSERLKDTQTWVEQWGYSPGVRQDLPTMVGLSPLCGSERCLTAVNDS